jgi:hypothetical protein
MYNGEVDMPQFFYGTLARYMLISALFLALSKHPSAPKQTDQVLTCLPLTASCVDLENSSYFFIEVFPFYLLSFFLVN